MLLRINRVRINRYFYTWNDRIPAKISKKLRIKWNFELTVFELTVPDLYCVSYLRKWFMACLELSLFWEMFGKIYFEEHTDKQIVVLFTATAGKRYVHIINARKLPLFAANLLFSKIKAWKNNGIFKIKSVQLSFCHEISLILQRFLKAILLGITKKKRNSNSLLLTEHYLLQNHHIFYIGNRVGQS